MAEVTASAPPRRWSAPKVPWNGRDALVVFLVPWVVLPLALILLLKGLSPYVPGVPQYLTALGNNDPGATFGLVIVDAIGSFGAIGYFLRKYHTGLATLGVRRFNLGKAILYLVGILAVFGFLVAAAYYAIQALDPHFNANQAQMNEFTDGTYSVINLLALVIIPPFVEETTFRGFMFPAFAKRWGVVVGAILTSILFGFAHLQANVSVYTFILSLLLCGLYMRTRSIVPGIALHMINNYIAYLGQLHK